MYANFHAIIGLQTKNTLLPATANKNTHYSFKISVSLCSCCCCYCCCCHVSHAIEPCSINLFDLCSRAPPHNKCRLSWAWELPPLSPPLFSLSLHPSSPLSSSLHSLGLDCAHVLCDFNWRLLCERRDA